ncbi:uncharacterized protein [Asterias amurensis]|uniref:uncharacterized protein n=1 Tax=Asterias amurensis TaxID=7602 RepID=UPI003AB6E4B7
MDLPPIKCGHLYRPQKGIKKYWVKRWALLYPGSEVNPPRLETFDSKDASYKEGVKPLVLYLPCPIKAFPTSQHRSRDFVIEIIMDDKVVAYAVDTREELNSWLHIMSEVSIGRTGKRECLPAEPPSSSPSSFSGEVAEGLQENTLYDSFETVAYQVSIKPNTFSEQLGLQGYFSLQIDSVKLTLIEDDSNDILYAWPYRYLRRYGRDKVSFSMEAGRKCDSGPGLLVFETKDGNDIFHNIQNFVNSISGKKATPPLSHNRHQETPHPQAGKPPLASRPHKTKPVAPQPLSRPHPKDPIGAITESSIFQQKLAAIQITKDEARGTDFVPRKPKPFKPRNTDLPRSSSPPTQVDPLYSEVQEGVDTQSNNNTPSPEEESEYSLLQDSEQPRLPPTESDTYDMPEPPGNPKNVYNMTSEEPRSDGWKTFGRTEDNIHTETYVSNEDLFVEDSKIDPKPVPAPVKPLKPKPLIRPKIIKAPTSKPETPEPVLSDANETLYDVCGSAPEVCHSPSVSEGDDVYDHFTRTNIAQPVPAPRKVIPAQQPQVDDESELYDRLQRETSVGGTRVPQQHQSQQRLYDSGDVYDSLVPDNGIQNVAGGTHPALPEESEYSSAVAGSQSHMYMDTLSKATAEPDDTDENPYDIVSFQ